MPRARLTEEERAERKRRAFAGAKFRQYDPNDGIGPGDPRQWRAAAGAAIGGDGFTLEASQPARRRNADLEMLNLTTMPTDKSALHRAYRLAQRLAHPDAGGSDAKFIAVSEAYARLKAKLK